MNDLDDYVLNDNDLPTLDVNKDAAGKIDDSGLNVQRQLEKTVKDFERTLTDNKFQSAEEKQELEHVVTTLKTKIADLERKTSLKPNNLSNMISPDRVSAMSLDINELRKRGL